MEARATKADAVEAFAHETIDRDPTNVTARTVIAESLFARGCYQDAVNQLHTALQLQPNNVQILLSLARICRDIGECSTCNLVLNHIHALHPGHPVANEMSKQVKNIIGEPDSARGVACRARELLNEFAHIGKLLTSSGAAALSPALAPFVIDMNGDLLRVPADLLSYLWHTHTPRVDAIVPAFQAETGHYHWIQKRLMLGDTAFDIGTSIGYFTVMMARAVTPSGQVHAFEPNPSTASDLRRVLALNEISNVTVNETAVSDRIGTATFVQLLTQNVQRESSHLNTAERDGTTPAAGTHWITVPTTTLDNYVLSRELRPSMLKIDVEGADLPVLYGSMETLRRFRPPIVLEIHSREDAFLRELHGLLDSLQYTYKYEDKICFCTSI